MIWAFYHKMQSKCFLIQAIQTLNLWLIWVIIESFLCDMDNLLYAVLSAILTQTTFRANALHLYPL